MAREIISYYTGSASLYAIIRRTSDAKVWDTTTSAFVTWADGDIANYDLALSSDGGDMYHVDWPTAMAAGNTCRYVVYARAGATPATTDSIVSSKELYWNGQTASSVSTISLDSYALTSLANLKTFMRITDSTLDTQLTQAINAATARIEYVTARKFVARDYTQWINGIRQRVIELEQFPVINFKRLAFGQGTAGSFNFTGTAIRATVGVSTTSVDFQTIVAAGTTTFTQLAFADYPTLSLLAAAAPAGWTASVTQDVPSATLNPTPGQNAKGRPVTLYYPDQADIDYSCDFARGTIEVRRLGYYWLETGFQRPSIASHHFEGRNRHPVASSPTQFQGILAEYRAGYATVPADVEMVCLQMSQWMLNSGTRDPVLTQTSNGPFSETYSPGMYDAYIQSQLAGYMDARAVFA